MNRRIFLRDSAIVLTGIGASPLWRTKALAQDAKGTARKKTLIVLFQRGAADGLNVVVPYSDDNYYALRPTLALPRPGKPNGVIDLDGRFGLNPSLKPLKDLWDSGLLGIVEATGSPDSSRSHFEAQDFMESGTSGVKTENGWLNRAMKTTQFPTSAFRLVSMGSQLPLTLRGEASAISVGELARIELGTGGAEIFENMYKSSEDFGLTSLSKDAFEMLKRIDRMNAQTYSPTNGIRYGGGDIGQGLLQIARLIKADMGVEAAFISATGWDHHSNESGQLSSMLSNLANSLNAFCADVGDRMKDIVIVTMSEFGRTAHENGNGGTDHGHGNLMMTIGGPVRGGKIYGNWPGLAPSQLFEQRDLAVTTDFRDVLGEILTQHMGLTDLANVFPGYSSRKALGFIRS